MNKLQKLTLLVFFINLLLGFNFSSLHSQTVYVHPSGTGQGTSWEDATSNLAQALENAPQGTQFWVAKGTYYPVSCQSDTCTTSERANSFIISDGISVWGGFVGDEESLEDRDWQANPTILSGDIDRDGSLSNNSFNVVYSKNVGFNTVIDGFTITQGNADFTPDNPGMRRNSGGGWYNEGSLEGSSSHPIINNCTFINNRAVAFAGGMLNNGGFKGNASPFYNNCLFKDNYANQAGGAVYNQGSFEGQSNPNFNNCTFDSNSSEVEGGAVYSMGSEQGDASPIFGGCTFTENLAGERGGAIYNRGSNNGQSNPNILACQFSNNQTVNGGAIYNDGGFSGESNVMITGCNFRDNIAEQKGGAIYSDGSFEGQANAVLINSIFNKNIAVTNGGGMFNDGSANGESSPSLSNCHFIENRAILGGGIFNFGKSGASHAQLTDCTFVQNSADEGSGMYNDGSFWGKANFYLENCIFSNNQSISNGGGMYNLAGNGGEILGELLNCNFLDNHSGFAGAGMFNSGIEGNCSPKITNCRFERNITDTYGGAIYNQGKSGNASPIITNSLFSQNHGFSAGGIYNLGAEFGNSSPIITNCTFYNNTAHVGGAVYSNAAEENIGTSAPVMTNCIFYKNEASFGSNFRIIQGNPTVSHCFFDVADCDALYSGIEGMVTCGEMLIFADDPMFIDTTSGNFHLRVASPVIDMGDNRVVQEAAILMDLDNQPRIQNGRVDFGVYENPSDEEEEEIAPSITQSPVSQEVCEGSTVNLSITVEGTAPFSYQWKRDGITLLGETGATLVIENIEVGEAGNYVCEVNNNTNQMVESEAAIVFVNPTIEVSAEIFVEANDLCADEAAYFWAQTAGGGEEPNYNWLVNGESAFVDSNVFEPSSLSDGDVVELILTSSENCPTVRSINSNAIVMNINPLIIADVNIRTNTTAACANETVTFIAEGENEGDNPIYQWFLNDVAVGANSVEYSVTDLLSTDVIYCQMISSAACLENGAVISNQLSIEIVEVVQPTISINTENTTICQGTMLSFSTSTQHAGSTPVYQWLINDLPVGENNPEFSTDNLENGDIVYCQMTSSSNCAIENEVISNQLIINVVEDVQPAITINVDSTNICAGSTLSFTATFQHEGDTPIYQWLINDLPVGENSPEFSTNNLEDGDVINCQMTSSSDCAIETEVISNELTITVRENCTTGIFDELIQSTIQVFPNPNQGQFVIEMMDWRADGQLEILNSNGQNIFTQSLERGQKSQQVQLENIATGVYFIKLINAEQVASKKVFIVR